VAIQGYTNSINAMDKQIAQMDAHISEFKETVKSNNVVILGLREENSRLETRVEQYSNAVDAVQAQLKVANDSIRRQNEALKGLVAERDEYVNRLNEALRERNQIVTQYNELAKRFEELQAAQQPKKKEK